MTDPHIFLGLDVQLRRRCPFYAIRADGSPLETGWLPPGPDTPAALRTLATRLADGDLRRIAIGIDAPRAPLPSARRWSWNGASDRWTSIPARSTSRGAGRHCEIVIKALGLANPQWSPVADAPIPDWMRLGFALFDALADAPHLHEIFPSAAYTQLDRARDATLTLSLTDFAPGPKDMLDAAVGALVVREFTAGRGDAVGGGDGLGAIILPRPIGPKTSAVHRWPGPPAADSR